MSLLAAVWLSGVFLFCSGGLRRVVYGTQMSYCMGIAWVTSTQRCCESFPVRLTAPFQATGGVVSAGPSLCQ
jgi:hypothetical protein